MKVSFDEISKLINVDDEPATIVRSQTPSMRSVMNTAAVTNVAKKKTIL